MNREYRGSVAKQINDRIAAGDLVHDHDGLIAFCSKLLAPVYGHAVTIKRATRPGGTRRTLYTTR